MKRLLPVSLAPLFTPHFAAFVVFGLLAMLVLLLTGCGVSTAPPAAQAPNYERRPPAVANPSVLIVGDSIVNAWCSAALLAQNPTWACQGSPAGVPQETSAEVLARFPKAVAASPKTIVIEAGTWDLNSAGTNEPNIAICDSVTYICANIKAMITEAVNAGIQVIVCSTLPWGAGPAATDNGSPAADNQHGEDISDFNVTVLGDAVPNLVQAVDMYAILAEPIDDYPGDMCEVNCDVYLPSYTDDGVNPNTLGGQMMTQAVQTALTTKTARKTTRPRP